LSKKSFENTEVFTANKGCSFPLTFSVSYLCCKKMAATRGSTAQSMKNIQNTDRAVLSGGCQ
jgi:hypothetical protein